MLAERIDIAAVLDKIYSGSIPNPSDLILPNDPLKNNAPGRRPLSACVEDCSFGDSAKGHTVQELNYLLQRNSPSGTIYSARWNGTRNAGHEIGIDDIKIALHQLPVAVVQERAVAIMGKGMLVHPEDLVTEIKYVESQIGSNLPGRLQIDQNAVVTTDIHAAFETFTNLKLDVGAGATGSGVAQGYATWYEKRALTMRDLKLADWRMKFCRQYLFYAKMMGGTEVLANTTVNALTVEGKRAKHPVGSLNEFLDRLGNARTSLIGYIGDVRCEIEDVWRNHPETPFTFEGAQGGGLDPYFGVYPDITASRPMGRVGIPDATEGVVRYEEIALKVSTLKNPYMSSVGARIPPYKMDTEIASMYRKENNETGRSTGRNRGIYPIDLVLMRAIRDVAGYEYLAVTHLDSNHADIPIEVVTHYVNKETGQSEPYRPYQWHWDRVEGKTVQLPSWNGQDVEKAKNVKDLPGECLQFLTFLSKILAPVFLGTNGPKLGQRILFTPSFKGLTNL